MIQTKTIFASALLFAFALLSSCLKTSSNGYEIENASGYDFDFGMVKDGDTSVFVSKNGSSETFYYESGPNVDVPPAVDFLTIFDRIFLETADTLHLLKDITLYENWQHYYEGNSARHRLVIGLGDIKP